MTPTAQHEFVEKLASLWRLSPDVRFGQLLANIGLLVEANTNQSLWNVEDEDLWKVMEGHHGDLLRRQEPEA
jgi:hypothetical protein